MGSSENQAFQNFYKYLSKKKVYSYSVNEILEMTKLTKYRFYRDYSNKETFLMSFFNYFFKKNLKEFLIQKPSLHHLKQMHAKILMLIQENNFLLVTANLKNITDYLRQSYIQTILNKDNRNLLIKASYANVKYHEFVEKSANLLVFSIHEQEVYLFNPVRF